MHLNSPVLLIEINNKFFTFVVGEKKENDKFKLIQSYNISLQGVNNNKIIDSEKFYSILKENIFKIEQKLNYIFKEVIIIVDNFNCSLINLTGFKRLNGSQLTKENITYILNTLKLEIVKFENLKTIIHIFNSKFVLDNKKIENLPIGLFGNFYSHELSFFVVNDNDFLNLKNIFKKCNLRIKKIVSKSFIEGANLSNSFNLDSFLKVEIDNDRTKLIFFENSALKFVQEFKFGSDLILNDISKIIELNKDVLEKILIKLKTPNEKINKDELIEEEFFNSSNFKKIKKKLIYEIAEARIQEMAEIIIFNNVNLKSFTKEEISVFLKINNKHINCFEKNFINCFCKNDNFKINLYDHLDFEDLFGCAFQIVQYGWKKEAVPVTNEKKSLIARFFDFFY